MTTRPRRGSLRAAAQRADVGTPAPGATAMSTRTIRTTLDLTPELWGDVEQWMAAERSAGRKQIKKATVFRALLTLLVRDPVIMQAVRDHIAGGSA